MTKVPLPDPGDLRTPVEPDPVEPRIPRWEHFAHEADIGVRGIGWSIEEAFEQAALALTAVIVPLDRIRLGTRASLTCDGEDPETMLVDWLNAIVFEIATRRMLFGAFEVRIDASQLTATAIGETVDPVRHEPAVEIKGATYTELDVSRRGDGAWVAQCVVDV